MQYSDDVVAQQTLKWVRNFIVAHNVCPFAQREVERDSIRVEVVRSKKLEVALEELMAEVQWLDEHPETETTLLVFPTLFKDFDHYLDYVELAESILAEQGYEGIYQLATFHPDYCFEDADPDDASNYTNRSPYAMVHLLREASVEKAIEFYGDTSVIPERNIEHLNAMGSAEAERCLQQALTQEASDSKVP
ncbi:DUF1415 domain-containing protein [Vreelandella populi]|uniref:DUF1415 domain-containing protein n=1 Tax=Vreelandella populi TaxID=2498858 RepID=A0A3S0YZ13_9GAMM|nr:DUF1415 domain-containing protein [Halomonas populi]RUR39247.1 DUF1415 domain-containing protein [Halomonas populi]RUR46359.1 DUF1415 domain-containing protein [Halomonas populi]